MQVAKQLHTVALGHLKQKTSLADLYRILVYDCPPLEKRAHLPVSKRAINFKTSDEAVFRRTFHQELKKLRKVALRLGFLADNNVWNLDPYRTKELLSGEMNVAELSDEDFKYSVRQKGVDIKLALDIGSLSLKRLVDQIILISGDSDFVPAAKLARREGIDFVLDPIWHRVSPDLLEHIDGVHSTCPDPRRVSSRSDKAEQRQSRTNRNSTRRK